MVVMVLEEGFGRARGGRVQHVFEDVFYVGGAVR
jgi:hypothetical protein